MGERRKDKIKANAYFCRINPLSLMEVLTRVVQQYDNADDALAFLVKCEPKLKSNDVAVALCWITKGEIIITKKQDVRATKVISFKITLVLLLEWQ